ncbi:MAG: hypothetical protein IT193_10540 [Propionibacteriaceae bacterium]|nr:hypothetical protein [Propionibacteriaceae bacterium]
MVTRDSTPGQRPVPVLRLIARSRRIGEFLKELDLTEGRSTGVPKILRAMRNNGSPDPVFVSNDDRLSFEVHLPVREGADWGDLLNPATQITTPVPPQVTGQVTGQVAPQVTTQVTTQVKRLIAALDGELERDELQAQLGLRNREHFRRRILVPAIDAGLVEMTDPASPNSPRQRYRLTDLGRRLRAKLLAREPGTKERDPE